MGADGYNVGRGKFRLDRVGQTENRIPFQYVGRIRLGHHVRHRIVFQPHIVLLQPERGRRRLWRHARWWWMILCLRPVCGARPTRCVRQVSGVRLEHHNQTACKKRVGTTRVCVLAWVVGRVRYRWRRAFSELYEASTAGYANIVVEPRFLLRRAAPGRHARRPQGG